MSEQKHYRACNLCEALCGLEIEVEGGQIKSIRGDAEDPFSKGHICPKAVALADIHNDPDRLKRPMRRKGEVWEEIGWEEAFEEVGARLRAVRQAHGRDAVGVYQGNPSGHNYGTTLYGFAVLPQVIRTKNMFSSMSVDHLPRMLTSLSMYGNQAVLPIPDLDRTSYFLMLGANPLASNGSIMTAPDVRKRLMALLRRGKLIVIDPRRTETAAIATEHHFIQPGSDALFLLGLLHTIFEERLASPDHLTPHLKGIEAVKEAAERFSPESIAHHTGIEAEEIKRIAREYAGAASAVCYGRMGVSVQAFGGLCHWLIDTLNIVTGNFDRAGGSMFPNPAVDLAGFAALADQTGHYDQFRSRVRGLPEFNGELPVSALAEEMETEGPGQIKALITSCGNPVLSTPNGKRLEKALAGLDFMVSIDIYLNETTQHADIILPPTFALEHDNYDMVFLAVAIRNTTRFSEALFEPEPDARHDWQIFLEILTRYHDGRWWEKALGGAARRLGHWFTPEKIIDLALRLGPYGDRFNPMSSGLSVKHLKKNPHGLDLGPMAPRLPGVLSTESGRIELAPKAFLDDLTRLEASIEQPEGSLWLIGRRDLRSNNSWMHNSKRLVRGKPRCTLMMHPEDAQERGLDPGQEVCIRSRVGEVAAPLVVTEDIMKGVVSLPHGWGHHRKGARLSVAAKHAGVSANDLTDELDIDVLCGTSTLNGVPVTVEASP